MAKHVPFSPDECCGCGVCAYLCPNHAISIKEDSEGFPYPDVDKTLCNDCGLCQKKCAFLHRPESVAPNALSVYVAKHNDVNIRMSSRSGGVFVSCSDWILSLGGSVYGCAMIDQNRASHIRATTKAQRDAMCKSKYVQSNTAEVWPLIKMDLKDGRYVLFSGTGCQVDALYSYLRVERVPTDKLYTMDLVCHGVPSPMLFREYIKWTENHYGGELRNFEFRDKTVCGWDGHIESFYINGKKQKSGRWRDLYATNSICRLSCSNCHYTSVTRVGDLSFADAWGIKEHYDQFNDNRGVSVVLVNNEKGRALLDAIEGSCKVHEMSLTQMMQPNLQSPSKPKVNREQLWQTYHRYGFEGLVDKYATPSFMKRVHNKLKYVIRKLLLGHKYYLPFS